MNDRVLLVSGSAPPDACGVGDYTQSLASALEKAGLRVELFCHRDWSISGSAFAIRKLLTASDALVHIQYPTMGYGYSLGPQLCALVKPSIVTLHEFSLSNPLRKLSLLPFGFRSPYVVMTSDFERRCLLRKMPWVGKRSRVIPIGSSIPPLHAPPQARNDSVAYFGLVMPRKGIEDFIELSRLIRAKCLDWDLLVIGKVPLGQQDYAKGLLAASQTLRIRWVLDRSAEEVAELLSLAGVGYLPFPDGASERRSSLNAALAVGLPSITTRSGQTPQEMAKAVVFATTASEAFEAALQLMTSKMTRQNLSRAAVEYSQRFTWAKIAESHIQMYQDLHAIEI